MGLQIPCKITHEDGKPYAGGLDDIHMDYIRKHILQRCVADAERELLRRKSKE